MNRMEMIEQLNAILLSEMPQYSEQAVRFAQGETEQRRLLRSLMNVRPPMPLQPEYLALQDRLLSAERAQKGVVDGAALPPIPSDARIAIWQGDITRLKVDAIVDADNKALLGCFCPCHGCIDNAIHSAAGLQLRDECNAMMERQGHPEPNGLAKLTRGYNLPARRWPDCRTAGDAAGSKRLSLLLHLLLDLSGRKRTSEHRLLLHFHRGVSFSQP